MTDWKPGQKLVGPNGERAIWLGSRLATGDDLVILTRGGGWATSALRLTGPCTPVDEWPDPVAEARERVERGVFRHTDEIAAGNIVSDLIHKPHLRADLRVLLDAEEAK